MIDIEDLVAENMDELQDGMPEEDTTFKPMDESEIESIARDAVSDAIDFVESEIAEDRI